MVTGVVLFAYIYFKYFNGDLGEIVRKPALLIVAIIPFLPAYILSHLASVRDKKVYEYLAKKPRDESRTGHDEDDDNYDFLDNL